MGIGLVYHNRKAIANRITPPPGNGCTKCLWGEVFVKVFIFKRRHLVLIGYVLAAAAMFWLALHNALSHIFPRESSAAQLHIIIEKTARPAHFRGGNTMRIIHTHPTVETPQLQQEALDTLYHRCMRALALASIG